MVVAYLTPTTKSGYIVKSAGGVYTVYAGATTIKCGIEPSMLIPGNAEYRMYLNVDANGVIPSEATIIGVYVIVDVDSTTQGGSNPDDWINTFYTGRFIDAALDSSDWDGGKLATSKDWNTSPVDEEVIYLDSQGLSDFTNDGDFDICIRDASGFTAGNGGWMWNGVRARFSVAVEYLLPPKGGFGRFRRGVVRR